MRSVFALLVLAACDSPADVALRLPISLGGGSHDTDAERIPSKYCCEVGTCRDPGPQLSSPAPTTIGIDHFAVVMEIEGEPAEFDCMAGHADLLCQDVALMRCEIGETSVFLRFSLDEAAVGTCDYLTDDEGVFVLSGAETARTSQSVVNEIQLATADAVAGGLHVEGRFQARWSEPEAPMVVSGSFGFLCPPDNIGRWHD